MFKHAHLKLPYNFHLFAMMPVQVRLTRRIVEEIDRLVEAGLHCSRSDFVRDAIRRHIEASRRE
jgi:Arc/MetJ-type ribon-helix-helix transcriptional regulator